MSKKRVLALALVFAALALLAWLQFRSWAGFDWAGFWQQTSRIHPGRIAFGVALIYGTYFMRALRWQVLLRPIARVPVTSLVGAQVVGFTAVAMLGRPGDLIRPYIVSRKHGLPLSSQLAIFAVERIFDIGCFALLLTADLLLAPSLQQLPHYTQFRTAGILLCAVVIVVSMFLYWIWKSGDAVADWSARISTRISPRSSERIRHKISSFSEALHTIHDLKSLLQILFISLVIWLTIALAYVQVMNAYPSPLSEMRVSQVLLAMSASIAGSLLQLPMVGGGSQLGTIAVLERVLLVPRELAASCGITLWLVTFASVVPLGLVLARLEHVRLRNLQEQPTIGAD